MATRAIVMNRDDAHIEALTIELGRERDEPLLGAADPEGVRQKRHSRTLALNTGHVAAAA
jgi:hypothetical protein